MEKKGNFPALTALKGLFILIIVLHNTLSAAPLFENIPGTAFLIRFGGFLGNSMFYILSGFLLSAGYQSRIRDHRISFREYLLRRLKKLYPMYILSNAAMLILEILQYGVSAINIHRLVFTALLVRSPYNTPTGFLCAVFTCYILFFLFCHAAKSRTHYVSYLILGVIAGYMLISLNLDLPYLTARSGVAYMNFFLGCILAEIYPRISENLHRWLQPLFLVLVPLLMLLMLSCGVEIIAGDVQVCFSFVLCPMILYLAWGKGIVSRVLQLRGFVALGKISSCVFFWHMVIYSAFTLVTRGSSIREPQYLLYFVLMLALSTIASILEANFSRKKALT